MPDGFKVASAYVTVGADIDETSARDAGQHLGEVAEQAAGQVKLKADPDDKSAETAGESLADVAREAAGGVKLTAVPDETSAASAGAAIGQAASKTAAESSRAVIECAPVTRKTAARTYVKIGLL